LREGLTNFTLSCFKSAKPSTIFLTTLYTKGNCSCLSFCKKKFAILHTLWSICAKHQKLYCFPSVGRIQEYLHRYHGFCIRRRTIFWHLRWLEDEGWIKRQRRAKRMKDGTFKGSSSLYFITDKAAKYLKKIVNFGRKLVSSLRQLNFKVRWVYTKVTQKEVSPEPKHWEWKEFELPWGQKIHLKVIK